MPFLTAVRSINRRVRASLRELKMKHIAQVLLALALVFSCVFAFTACESDADKSETTTKMTLTLVKPGDDGALVDDTMIDAETETEYYEITGFTFSSQDTEILSRVASDKNYYEDSYSGIRKDSESYKKEKTRYNECLKKLVTDGLTLPTAVKTDVKESKITLDLAAITADADNDGNKIVNVAEGEAKYTVKVRSVKASALYGHTEIEKLVVPANYLAIGEGAFGGMSALKSITLPFVGAKANALNGAKNFGYIFGTISYDGGTSVTQNYNASGTATYYVPATLTEVTVNGLVGKYAFHNVSTVKKVNFETEGAIYDYAFYGCTSLETVNLDGATIIGKGAFGGCTALYEVTGLENVTSFGEGAFQTCTSLNKYNGKTLTLNNVASVGEKAFYGCSSIEKLVCTPAADATVGAAAFASMSALKTAEIANLTLSGGAFASWSDMLTVTATGCTYFDGSDYKTAFVGAFEEGNTFNQKANIKFN